MKRFDPEIHSTPLVLPDALMARMAEIRRERGTAAADRYADVILSEMRRASNEAYMRRHVGAPGMLALRAFAWWTVLIAPVLWMLSGSLSPEMLGVFSAIGACQCVGQAIAAYVDGGRSTGDSHA